MSKNTIGLSDVVSFDDVIFDFKKYQIVFDAFFNVQKSDFPLVKHKPFTLLY